MIWPVQSVRHAGKRERGRTEGRMPSRHENAGKLGKLGKNGACALRTPDRSARAPRERSSFHSTFLESEHAKPGPELTKVPPGRCRQRRSVSRRPRRKVQ
eukprot:scaffold361_cov248-Pinguiococcus_pyrenoidosus.AAC.5